MRGCKRQASTPSGDPQQLQPWNRTRMSVYAHLTTNRASAPRLLIACSFAAMGLAIYLTDLAEQRIDADDHAWRSALLCTDALTVLAIWSERRATGKFEGFYGWVEQNAVRREALGI